MQAGRLRTTIATDGTSVAPLMLANSFAGGDRRYI